MSKIKVAIVEDHADIREGLLQLINNHDRFTVVSSYPDCTDIINKLEADKPDIVLMDIQLPGISGIEGIKLIKSKFPGIKLIVQTIFEDDEKIFLSICAGASGYLLKKNPPKEIVQAIEEVYDGGARITPSIASRVLQMFRAMNDVNIKPESQLSKREYEVLQELVNGLSYKQIAAKLDITYDTVRFHMKNIYVKLQVSSISEAVGKAIRQRLV
jgi:DNA-binding NarL/FixJ family response regulator